MLEENISEKSGFVRLSLGAGMTAFGIAHLSRKDGSKSLGSLLVMAGAMKIAEGIFLYCPTKALFSSNVQQAVTNSFENFMDGDSLMQAFNQSYESKWNSNQGSSTSSSSGQSKSQGGLAKAATQAVQSMANSTQTGSIVNAATQAVETLAGGGNSSSKNKQNNNSTSKNKQSQSASKDLFKENSGSNTSHFEQPSNLNAYESGQSAVNPS